ncbi:MAG: HlyD family efflux transporter periplasmic adaptor subunit, partial [Candidatus Hydrogenedentota bacterium]
MIPTEPHSPIVMPSRRRGRILRQRLAPFTIWGGAIVIFLLMNAQSAPFEHAIGIVEIDEVILAPLEDGTIRSLNADRFDTVQEGDVIAMMDDTMIVAELTIEEAKLGQIRAELEVERNRLENDVEQNETDQLDDLRRYRLDEEKAHLEHLELSVNIEADRVKLERFQIEMDRQKNLVTQKIGDVSTYDDIRLRHQELAKELDFNAQALRIAKRNADTSTARRIEREDQLSSPARNTLLYLEPYLQELKVQEARREEIQQERLALMLRAPISGQIAQVFYGPGETILSGTPLLTIQSNNARRVIAYVNEKVASTIQPGTEVQLRSQARPQIVASAKILRSGSALEELPSRIWSTPIIAQWGYPVLIGDIPPDVFLPGET